MPRLTRDDGIELHYEERGSGPLVVLAAYWSLHPSVFEPIMAELAGDHRVARYDDRGTGLSTHAGPYDLETAAADLAAVIEAAGGPAIVICTADGANRAVRMGSRRPELIEAAVVIGGAPLGREKFAELDVLSASDGVVEALLAQVETDYRGTLRGVLAATNRQMSEDELRERIDAQVEHVPHEAAVPRLRAWAADQPLDDALALGDRLWVLVAENLAGGWFPAGRQMAEVVERELPQARIVEVADGMLSRPDETARVVRRLAADRGVAAAD
jgi:pimeloyl-ACP methyl ester carboxylesterase